MSTRSCIARVRGDGFKGVYHHWDGNPSVLGATLYKLAQGYLNGSEGGVPGMLELLIDQHPAGWSTINGADWLREPGFAEDMDEEKRKRPQCYCHGDRSEEASPVTQDDDMGMEYAYVFDEEGKTMAVCERVRSDGDHADGSFGSLGKSRETGEREDAWVIRSLVDLTGPEPDWALVECGLNLERCQHIEGHHQR